MRKEKSWEDEPGKCFIDIEIDFESTGYSIDTNYMTHRDFQRPPEGEDLRIMQSACVEGVTIPQTEMNLLQLCCPTIWTQIWKIIDETEI